MKTPKITILVMSVWLLGSPIFITYHSTRNQSSSAQTKNKQVIEIEGYKDWTKVNPTPQLMPDIVAISCVGFRSPNGKSVDSKSNPHLNKYITVFVNDMGRKAMLSSKSLNSPKVLLSSKRNFPPKPAKHQSC